MRDKYIELIKEYIKQKPGYEPILDDIKKDVLLVGATEEEFEEALKEAFENNGSFSILDVHLDPHDISPGLRRLTNVLGKRVK